MATEICPHHRQEFVCWECMPLVKEKMMCEKRCKNCEFWESVNFYRELEQCGWCVSERFNRSLVVPVITTNFKTVSSFCCIHWIEKECNLQEQLAKFLFGLWRDWLKSRMDFENISEGLWKGFLDSSDKILEIVEKGRKNG